MTSSAPYGHPPQQNYYPGQQQPAPPQVQGPPQGQQSFPQAGFPPPQPRNRRLLFEILAIIGTSLLTAGMFLYFVVNVGVGTTLMMTVLALIPLAIVLTAVLWVDRWEPEPRMMLLIAFLWGAGASTVPSMFMNEPFGMALYNVFSSMGLVNFGPEGGPPVFGAPFIEEFWKGAGLLLLFLVRRRHFNSAVDGVVYAFVIAAGFAFTENILYFLQSPSVLATLTLRGLLSPFGHLLYTAAMGLALGWSRHKKFGWVWALPIGYVVAVFAHMMWNLGATVGMSQSSPLAGLALQFVLLNWIPTLLLFILIAWLHRQEIKVIRARLSEYMPFGWFAPHEVEMLTSMRDRRRARAWAKNAGGPNGAKSMKEFQLASTKLAFARNDLHSGHDGIRAREEETAMLNKIGASRGALMASTMRQPGF